MESPVWREVLVGSRSTCRWASRSRPEGTGTGAALLGHHALGSLPDLDSAADLIAVDRGQSPESRRRRDAAPPVAVDGALHYRAQAGVHRARSVMRHLAAGP